MAGIAPTTDRFNPLPSPKQGETPCLSCVEHTRRGFNPLPSPKQGETGRIDLAYRGFSSFNPLPSPKQGETPIGALSKFRIWVSIRSPHRSKGRLDRGLWMD